MNKKDFIYELRKRLIGLPQDDVEESVIFYSEMIDDLMEEGLSEEDAVLKIGSLDNVVSNIVEDIPLSKFVKKKIKSTRKLRVWEIVLLILGSPVWIPILISVFAVILSIYVSLWSVIISLWSVFASFICFSLGAILSGIGFVCGGHVIPGIFMICASVFCTGLSIFIFFGCRAITKGILLLTKNMVLGIKNSFVKKEDL